MVGKTLDFSDALRELKAGKKLTRRGWNGNSLSFAPDMYIWLEKPYMIERKNVPESNENMLSAFGRFNEIMKLGTFIMKTKDNKIMAGWLATNTDLLADDWMVVD